MNTSKTEFLSALLDDEAGDFERRRLLDELGSDDELGKTLSRYALIGEAMRAGGEKAMGMGDASFLAGIQDALEDEPAYDKPVVQAPTGGQGIVRSWRVVGLGLAATVAAVAVGGMLFMNKPSGQPQMAQAPAGQAAPVTTVAGAEVTEQRIRQLGRVDSQTRDILKQYVAQHVKYASTTAIAPSIRAVSYANE